MPGFWGRGNFFLLETWFFGCSTGTEHSAVRNLSGHGGSNSPALSMFSGKTGMIHLKTKQH